MPKITIFGAGITGMAIASQLPKGYDITIVARDLPGDPPSAGWASPWACAGWVALGGLPHEKKMQLVGLTFLRKLASIPESGVCLAEMTDVGFADTEDLWFHSIAGFHILDSSSVKYSTVVVKPTIFLPWFRAQLESAGVRFQRIATIQSLGELVLFGHDVLVNASGLASKTLTDVRDDKVTMDRTYTVLVKSEYRNAFVRRGAGQYTYVFGRQDGTAVIGGVSEPISHEPSPMATVYEDLFRRAHEDLPQAFPASDPKAYTIITDLVGIRPLRLPEVRVEKEVLSGERVVHAYGTTIGGYILSFGLAREVVKLVDEYIFNA